MPTPSHSSITQAPARLELKKINVSYQNRPALVDVSLQINHGDQVAVIGPNGAGKSTLFKALVGLLPIQSGQILIHTNPLDNHLDCVAYVPQREEVDWHFPVTVLDVVMMGRFGKFGWLKPPKSTDRAAVEDAMRKMNIQSLASRRIEELSGGQQQRVFLARALAQEPHILLLDEPFSGVDVSTQEATLEVLDSLRDQDVTVLVSTHDLSMAKEHFEQVVLLNHCLIASGTPDSVFTAENIAAAFGGHVLYMNGAAVIDQCCPGEEETHA